MDCVIHSMEHLHECNKLIENQYSCSKEARYSTIGVLISCSVVSSHKPETTIYRFTLGNLGDTHVVKSCFQGE